MPRLPINDALGLAADGKLAPGASLLAALPQFARLRDLPLDQVPLDQASADLDFTRPLTVPVEGLDLSVGAAGGGRIAIIRPERHTLAADDPFDAIAVRSDEIWLAVELHVSAEAGAAASAGHLAGGLSLERSLAATCYRRFRKDAGFPPFAAALGRTLAGFALPKSVADLLDLDADSVLTLAGGGTLAVSGDFTLALPVEALASVAAAGVTALQIQPAASATLGARVEIAGDYQVRLRRLDPSTVELGLYRLKSCTLEAHVTARAGLAVKVAGFEVAERLVGALSSRPAIDVEEFRRALPGEDARAKDAQIVAWQGAIQGAVSTKLQVSLAAAISRSRSNEAVWLYHIDPEKAAAGAASPAVLRALAGDFTPLAAQPPPDGVRQVRNLLTDTDASKQSLRINLLGLVNVLSTATLARTTTVGLNAAGEVTLIADAASSSRLRALLRNAGGDARRLRKMLGETFLIEAAYQVTGLGALPPGFRSRHTWFMLDEDAGRDRIKDMLDVPRVLGAITPAQAELRLGSGRSFGSVSLYVELRYDDRAVRSLFLDGNGNPRSQDHYETLGRSALGALLFGDAGQELRRRFSDLGMAGTELWRRMKQAGNTRLFGPLFGLPADSSDPQLAAAGSDYIAIADWARAMHAAAAAVREVVDGTSPAPVASGPRLDALRQGLKTRLAAVVRDTHDQFGDPLGLLMVYLAAGQSAARTVRLTGDRIDPLNLEDGETLADA